MLAFRSIARAAPRIASRQSLRSFRPVQPFVPQPVAAARVVAVPWTRFAAPFSSSSRRLEGNEDELVIKLESEIQIELEDENSQAKTDQKSELDRFSSENGWEVTDVEGQEEVVLTKKNGDETIRVTFSIDDINNGAEADEDAYGQDPALEDEPELQDELQAGNKSKNGRSPADEEDLDDEADAEGQQVRELFPAKLSINVSKQGKPGALVIEALVQYGQVTFEDFYYFEDGKVSQPSSYDSEAKRVKAYAGPPFGTLDMDLAELLHQYLADRGVNEALAEYVTGYIEFKEAREYLRWLQNLKSFME